MAFRRLTLGPGGNFKAQGDLTPVVYMVWALGVPLVLEFAFWVQRQPWKKANQFAKFNLATVGSTSVETQPCFDSIEKPYHTIYLVIIH